MTTPSPDIERDLDLILWSAGLTNIFRYTGQKFWERETENHLKALGIDTAAANGNPIPRSESVADHSWHMADMALILAPRFPHLDIGRCVMLAVLHDKLEIITGDKDPLGSDGSGRDSHAFNLDKRRTKDDEEREALVRYLDAVNEDARSLHKELLLDAIEQTSPESRFIKALDRLQPLVYIIRRKSGVMEDDHIIFTITYTGTFANYFPALEPYYKALIDQLLSTVAKMRHVSVADLKKILL